MSLYSVVVPVYNSEHTLGELYTRLEKVFRETLKEDFELILVDDGSKDRSYEIMTELREKDHRVRIIQMARNFGQHPALLCGFAHVKGEFVVTMDDDLQHQNNISKKKPYSFVISCFYLHQSVPPLLVSFNCVSENIATITNNIHASAFAMENRIFLNASLYIRIPITSVARTGPPPVSAYGKSNEVNPCLIVSIRFTVTVGSK